MNHRIYGGSRRGADYPPTPARRLEHALLQNPEGGRQFDVSVVR